MKKSKDKVAGKVESGAAGLSDKLFGSSSGVKGHYEPFIGPEAPSLDVRIATMKGKFKKASTALSGVIHVLERHYPEHNATYAQLIQYLNEFNTLIFVTPAVIADELYDKSKTVAQLEILAEQANALPDANVDELLARITSALGFSKLVVAKDEKELASLKKQPLYIQYEGIVTDLDTRNEIKTMRNIVLQTLYDISQNQEEIEATHAMRKDGCATKAQVLIAQRRKDEAKQAKINAAIAQKAQAERAKQERIERARAQAAKQAPKVLSTPEAMSQFATAVEALVSSIDVAMTKFDATTVEKLQQKFEFKPIAEGIGRITNRMAIAMEFARIYPSLEEDTHDPDTVIGLASVLHHMASEVLVDKAAIQLMKHAFESIQKQYQAAGNAACAADCQNIINALHAVEKANEPFFHPRHRDFIHEIQKRVLPPKAEQESLIIAENDPAIASSEVEDESAEVAEPPFECDELTKIKSEVFVFRALIKKQSEHLQGWFLRWRISVEHLHNHKAYLCERIDSMINEVGTKGENLSGHENRAAIDQLLNKLYHDKANVIRVFDLMIEDQKAHAQAMEEIYHPKKTVWDKIKAFFKSIWTWFLKSIDMDKDSVAARKEYRANKQFAKAMGGKPLKKTKHMRPKRNLVRDMQADFLRAKDNIQQSTSRVGMFFTALSKEKDKWVEIGERFQKTKGGDQKPRR